MDEQPAWVAEKAEMDALDDGHGPYLYWALQGQDKEQRMRVYWKDFLAAAGSHLGQGYSLACNDGQLVDRVTAQAFQMYVAGREYGKASDNPL